METIQAIMTRRSIRKYTTQSVSAEVMDQLLKAAMQAPSARNTQPWHFIIIDNKALLHEVPKFHPYSDMLRQAAAVIVVCGDLTLEKDLDYLNQNCSAATENLLLAAHASGLGAVWLGLFPRDKRVEGIRHLLKLPQYIIPISMIALGYPAEEKQAVDRFNLRRVHFNGW